MEVTLIDERAIPGELPAAPPFEPASPQPPRATPEK